ncbi:MAG: hypothetical protein ACE37K_19345 [Planctomycetota bacterium]
MGRVEPEAAVATVVEADLRPAGRLVAAPTVGRPPRLLANGELAAVHIVVAVAATLARSGAKAARRSTCVAGTARNLRVRPLEPMTRPWPVLEPRAQLPEAPGVVATGATVPAVDLARQALRIETPSVHILVTVCARIRRADEPAHASVVPLVAQRAGDRVVRACQRERGRMRVGVEVVRLPAVARMADGAGPHRSTIHELRSVRPRVADATVARLSVGEAERPRRADMARAARDLVVWRRQRKPSGRMQRWSDATALEAGVGVEVAVGATVGSLDRVGRAQQRRIVRRFVAARTVGRRRCGSRPPGRSPTRFSMTRTTGHVAVYTVQFVTEGRVRIRRGQHAAERRARVAPGAIRRIRNRNRRGPVWVGMAVGTHAHRQLRLEFLRDGTLAARVVAVRAGDGCVAVLQGEPFVA